MLTPFVSVSCTRLNKRLRDDISCSFLFDRFMVLFAIADTGAGEKNDHRISRGIKRNSDARDSLAPIHRFETYFQSLIDEFTGFYFDLFF